MRKVIANEWMTLRGRAGSQLCRRGRDRWLRDGGWHTRYLDEVSMNWVIETCAALAAT